MVFWLGLGCLQRHENAVQASGKENPPGLAERPKTRLRN